VEDTSVIEPVATPPVAAPATSFWRQQSVVSLASFVVSLVALTALVPVLVRALGPKEYGAWVLTGGIVSYITLVDFGMSLTIARFVALSYRKRSGEAEQAITVGLAVVGAVGLALAALAFAVADAWQRYLDVAGTAFALRLASLALILLLLSKVLQSALEGAGNVGQSRLIQAGAILLFAAAGIAAVVLSSNQLEALSLVLVANSALTLVAYGLFLLRAWHWRRPLAKPSRGAWRGVIRYALTMQAGSVVGFSVDPVSRFLLAAASGPAAVTPLDLALRATTQWFGAALAFTRPILPSLGHMSASRETIARRTELLWRRFADAALTCGCFLAVFVWLVFPALFGHVGSYAARLGAVSVLLWTPSVMAIVPYLYIVLYGRARDVLKIQLVTSAIGIGLMLALVWTLHAWAPVLGLGIGSLVGSLVTLQVARRRAEDAAQFALPRPSLRAVAAPTAAAVLALMPLPLAVRLAAATVVWFAVAAPSLRAIVTTLGEQ
jgi:O-antigen/teichoic acid export membrane protein